MRIDTRSELARAQHAAHLELALGYRPRATAPRRPGVKRVLVTGFGRFLRIGDNASGRLVSALAGLPYPETAPPKPGAIDPRSRSSRSACTTSSGHARGPSRSAR